MGSAFRFCQFWQLVPGLFVELSTGLGELSTEMLPLAY